MRWAKPLVQSDGKIRAPKPAEMAARETALKQLRSNTANAENVPAWTFLGPQQTFDTDGTTVVTWQTNIYSVDIAPSDPNTLYAGGETGGIWKTTDKGLHWTLLTTNVLHGSFGAVRIHPSDPKIVYAATSGKIIKTTDGGLNWNTVYTENNLWVNDLAIKSDAPNVVLAASDQGLLRTANSGTNWSKIHTERTWTVKFKPGDPSTAFCVRKNGNGSDLRISTDGGEVFSNSNTGWWVPGTGEAVTGALLAVCPSQPSKIYAYLCGSGSNLSGYIGVFVSTNSGASWANTHPTNAIGDSPTEYVVPTHTNLMTSSGLFGDLEQGFYDMAIIVNPNNANELITGGTSWWKSANGGQTWTALGSYAGGLAWSHPDMQALAVAGNDLWIATDGGLDYSPNFGGSIEARMNGISGADLWGFDAGWNEDVLVGGRYHNGNMAWHESFPAGKYYRMGGAESPTGYVNPGQNRKTYFSDIGGYWLEGGFDDGARAFPIGLSPNESYAYYANSEMAWDPRCWNITYLGYENKIWKSTDGGSSYTVLHTFPGAADKKVYEIEVSRSNPNVLYCSQWDGTDDVMWKTTNGGTTWMQLTPLPLPNNNDRVKIALSAEDENVLWVALTYGSNGKKIYKSVNGGTSWINLTTSTLDNIRVSNIMAQYGTDGGVYLGCDGAVFYRNNSLSDWQSMSDGLPISAETNRLKPFYRDGKIRNGTWGFGVWESDLYEPSSVVAQPIASALEVNCARDTVYFDDYSVVNHTGATWSWTFSPAPVWSGATNVRNPKVVFGAAGNYTATMTLNGTFSKSLNIQVADACKTDTIPGSAALLGGNDSEDYVALPSISLNTNTLTVTAWIKADGTQPEYSSIFMHDGDDIAGFNFRPNSNRLGYHWPNGQWGWDNGPIVPAGQWAHVAMVVEPTGITLYVNGKGSKHTFTVPMANFDSGLRLGSYRGWGGRFVKGAIDEVCIFNNSLTQNQIRELMHLTKDPAQLPNLVAYYQFNEPNGPALDRVGTRHAALAGGAVTRIGSNAPLGKGISKRLSVTAAGTYDFTGTGLTLTFPNNSTYPNGELCVSRINQNPDQLPNAQPHSNAYWVVNNFGTNTTFSTLTSLRFDGYGDIPTGATASDYHLYKRGSFDEGNTWASADDADAFVSGANGSLTFSAGNGQNSFSQFVISYSGTLPVEWSDFLVALEHNRQTRLYWSAYQTADVSHFVIEKSSDGLVFQPLGTVSAKPGAGFCAYEAIDNQPFKGLTYYRIRQVDADGKFSYSSVRSVVLDALANDWVLSPNPLSLGQSLAIRTAYEGEYRVRLFDFAGKKVFEKHLTGSQSLALPALATGLYGYEILSETKRVSGKLAIASR